MQRRELERTGGRLVRGCGCARSRSWRGGLRGRWRGSRALTFLETVAAMAILALLAATVGACFSFLSSSQIRQGHQLAAMELANRLMLQYLDDPETMPNKALPVQYGRSRYRWELRESPVKIEPAKRDVFESRTANARLSLDRLKAISITVWLGEDSGGSAQPEVGVPVAGLTRLVDPIVVRNPDTFERIMNDPVLRQKFIDQFTGAQRATSIPAGEASRPRER